VLSFLDMRVTLLAGLALLAAVQGEEAAARGSRGGWSGGGGHGWSGGHFRAAPVARTFYAPVRVVPRAVFVAPFFPYYAAPVYYPPAPVYYPPATYYPPETTTYVEPPLGYSPPPPPVQAPITQAPSAQPGPYSVEQGLQYRYYCPDTRRYYPDTKACASGWLTVLPGGGWPPQ